MGTKGLPTCTPGSMRRRFGRRSRHLTASRPCSLHRSPGCSLMAPAAGQMAGCLKGCQKSGPGCSAGRTGRCTATAQQQHVSMMSHTNCVNKASVTYGMRPELPMLLQDVSSGRCLEWQGQQMMFPEFPYFRAAAIGALHTGLPLTIACTLSMKSASTAWYLGSPPSGMMRS